MESEAKTVRKIAKIVEMLDSQFVPTTQNLGLIDVTY
jgi:hypothetical protein